MENKTRGSVWRRWDLHVHTKGTNKNDLFTSDTFEDFCEHLFNKAIEKEIAVIGITDYFSIENYLRVKQYQDNLSADDAVDQEQVARIEKIKNILLLPNVELRIPPVTKEGKLVNFHCIFNPAIIEDLDEDFFGSIGASTYKMTRAGITRFGKSRGGKLDDEAAYKAGISEFWVEPSSLESLFSKNPNLRANTFTVISNKSNDGASGFRDYYDNFENERGSSTDAIRDSLYKISDAIFTSNPGARDYFLGKKRNGKGEVTITREEVINKYGSLKPCIHGSDAHSEEKLFTPDDNRNCWIKSDTTFEGLLHTKYEPEQRVKIQEHKPDLKEDRVIIDYIQYQNALDVFNPERIYLNPNLNVIIGGKSSGKSILLYNIAKTLQTNNEVDKLMDNRQMRYDFRATSPDFNFTVTSKNGLTRSLYGSESESTIIPNIKYIPQNHLAELAEPEYHKRGEDLLKVIRELLLEDDEYKKAYQKFIDTVRQNDDIRNKIIDEIFEIEAQIKRKNEDLKELGNVAIYKESIARISAQIDKLKHESGLEKRELDEFDKIQAQLNAVIEKDQSLQQDFEVIQDFIKKLSGSLTQLKTEQSQIDSLIENDELKTIFNQSLIGLNLLLNNLKILIDSSTLQNGEFIHPNEFSKIFDLQAKNKNDLLAKLKPFYDKSNIQKQIPELEKKLHSDRVSLAKIEQMKVSIELLNVKLNEKINLIFESYSQTQNEYRKIIDVLSERTRMLEDENLEITGAVKFNHSKFLKQFGGLLDRRRWSKDIEKEYSILIEGKGLVDFTPEYYSELQSMFIEIFKKDFILNKSVSRPEGIKALFYDYFVDFWQVISNEDEIGSMSTGKASFVLLKMIVGLSNSKSPILIDQPEDNLDNRSISEELIEYLRKKKEKRQIILVTHNPNIVVNADAENVIVANQQGQSSSGDGKYKFDYINGALENTKSRDRSNSNILTSMGIKEHVADIVEGGKEAFLSRERKYRFVK